jgi:hypothetical protein
VIGMRIYEGSPRQDWEEVLRTIGAYADAEGFKELLLLELDGGFIMQALAIAHAGAWSESSGSLVKRTIELPDDGIAEMMDQASAQRSGDRPAVPQAEPTNYYQQALRVIGRHLDGQKARDVFFFEQDGAFVLRLLMAQTGGAVAHELVEFTRDDILAMIGGAPQHRGSG